MAIDRLISVFVNGRLYFDNIRVEARAGSYDVGLNSASNASRCQANDVWGYSFD